ncbi:MAG: hypothetical protein H6948_02565 [Zoogloeaceae bacterium]|nr:hypothetical protein [Zoogloeaceae bacterium]
MKPNNHHKSGLALVVAFLAVVAGAHAAQGRQLNQDELAGLLSDHSYHFTNEKNGWTMKIFTEAGGKQEMRFLTGKKAGTSRTVRWAVEDGQRCIYRDDQRLCAPVYDMGNGTYHVVEDGEHRGTIRDVQAGNQL